MLLEKLAVEEAQQLNDTICMKLRKLYHWGQPDRKGRHRTVAGLHGFRLHPQAHLRQVNEVLANHLL
jgi:hypothetical protein